MKAIYTASATSIGGRGGHVRSANGTIDMDLSVPKEMGGKSGKGTNPEELFAAGYSACFNSALNLAARMKRIKVGETKVTIAVSLGMNEEDDSYSLAARIEAEIPGVAQDEAMALMERAHDLCPYSRATRGNIEVELHVKMPML